MEGNTVNGGKHCHGNHSSKREEEVDLMIHLNA